MKTRPYHAMPRLVAAMAGHFFLFPRLRGLAQRQSLTHEAWEFFWISLIAGITLVFSISAIIRGKPEEKVAGILLSAVPALRLVGAFALYPRYF